MEVSTACVCKSHVQHDHPQQHVPLEGGAAPDSRHDQLQQCPSVTTPRAVDRVKSNGAQLPSSLVLNSTPGVRRKIFPPCSREELELFFKNNARPTNNDGHVERRTH